MDDAQAHFCCQDHSGQDRITAILDAAETRARSNGARLTPVRKRTLELLLQAHGAMGAYDLLEKLAAEGFGTQPPVAYRALNFLVDQGLAHRIRRLNAFTACAHPGHEHSAAFLICESCNSVTEAAGDSVGAALSQAATAVGFALSRATVEAVGQCAPCRMKASV